MAEQKAEVKCERYNGNDNDQCKKDIQQTLNDCLANNDLKIESIRNTLTKKYNYACLVVKNVKQSSYCVGEIGGVYSSWKHGDDQYGIYIITGVRGQMKTEIK